MLDLVSLFLLYQISNVIHESRALDMKTNVVFPLGETASAIRGENVLWLAMVLRNRVLLDLKPAQLAAVCGSLVSEGIKVRPWKNNSSLYEPSSTVINVINILEEQRNYLVQLQEKHDVSISCCLDSQFSGMVEAWASGLTWREVMMDCAMDEGDLARLLRRTIDLLAQIPNLPDIDPVLQINAMTASGVMDRSPIRGGLCSLFCFVSFDPATGYWIDMASTPVKDVLDVEYNPSALAYVPPHAREKKDNCLSLLIEGLEKDPMLLDPVSIHDGHLII
ncbi:hypothetical protein Cgig2_006993 [Carnegiea gigantea]|uniref:ATP-dependent RNA helicase Ski2/MTR4 C-terminal domain-containing protein n=1 Tax=Carnegiea gigantea TaxID=171969 RepID=A0A9Q1KAT6_9CARY|nr:hypothetical protein Cgig2_006993 [Carnegiea gigantea]